MKVIISLLVLIILSGCMTTYEVRRIAEDGTSIVVVVKSFREFEQPQLHYYRAADEAQFTFGAASATTAVSPLEQAIADGIRSGTVLLNPPQ